MPNNRYSDRDQGNTEKETMGKKGMKNDDGRLKGAEWSSQVKTAFNDKSVGVEPNDGAPHLPSPSVSGEKV